MSDTDGGTGFEIFAKLSASVDGLAEETRRARAEASRPPTEVAWQQAMSGLIPSGAGSVLGINLGGPAMGHRWHVRAIVVGGTTPTTAAAGRADVFITGFRPISEAPVATDTPGRPGVESGSGLRTNTLNWWRDQATSLPLVAFYGRGEMVVRSQESLWVVFSSGTAGQVYAANCAVEDYEDAAYRQVIGL